MRNRWKRPLKWYERQPDLSARAMAGRFVLMILIIVLLMGCAAVIALW